ncbi:hypothetical protein LPJ53_001619 [Coemansia erecta]|uniref:FHF complex subunit HOOK-interacting protein C-terminal domain-containing protein n=1 Tax=Coemansia erecta TaxID=147472 RepID=A0A9W7Y4K1_9FUNG|nr:hypothetical protein LPJ53_001619 [Coemansia erecta]
MDGFRPNRPGAGFQGNTHAAHAQHTAQQGGKPRHLQRRGPGSSPAQQQQQQQVPLHSQARTAAAEVFDRVRSLVDNVSATLDGPTPTTRDRLVDNWTRIQDHFARADVARQQIGDTTIPHHLEQMLHILAREMLETADAQADEGAAAEQQQQPQQRLAQPLEFGPCVEYLLQYHVLSDLVDLADADRPRGMRAHVVRFFCLFIEGIPLGLLPESAIRLPLVAVMRQCLHVVQTSATTAINPMRRQEPLDGRQRAAEWRLGQGYHSMLNDKAAVILCHDLLMLIVIVFRRLREHASMVYLFFDWDSARPAAAGAAAAGDLAVAALRSATAGYLAQSARGHELFIVHVIVEYLLAPGLAGQLAREALVLVAQVLLAPADKARHVGFLLEQARVVELLVEHMGYLHAQMPVFRPMARASGVRLFGAAYGGARGRVAPVRRRMLQAQGDAAEAAVDIRRRLQQQLASAGQLRSAAQQEQRETAILASARQILEHVDAFFLCWELLDEIAFVAHGDARVCAAVQSQLTNGLLRTHVEPALLMASMDGAKNQAITTVSYLTDLVNATNSTCVLDALFAVLLGGDLAPEQPPQHTAQREQQQQQEQEQPKGSSIGGKHVPMDMFSPEDRELLESIEDDAMRAEAAALLLPPGFHAALALAESDGATAPQPPSASAAASSSAPATLRATLIGWMTLEDSTHLSLNTLRLFDTMLSTLNQFAYTSLVLRNFIEAGSGGGDDEDDAAVAAAVWRGPALGRGESVAADQELVRAVVERFLDAAPSSVAAALPESVVAAALRLDGDGGGGGGGGGDAPALALSPPLQPRAPHGLNALRSLMMMREAHGCDEYVGDSLRRLRASRRHVAAVWQPLSRFVRQHGAAASQNAAAADSPDEQLAALYPGGFLASLISQLGSVVRRHMAYNLMLTSMVHKLACLGYAPLSAYVFLANSATLPHSPAQYLLYDAFVGAAADAYVKSERVPRFAARLARQHREGVEAAVRVGAAAGAPPAPSAKLGDEEQDDTPLSEISRRLSSISTASAARQQQQQQRNRNPDHSPNQMDVDSSSAADSSATKEKNRQDVARAVAFLGTPIKRFVHGYIVLDEFAKEMAGAALALHTVELDRASEGVRGGGVLVDKAGEEYADLLEYYDPREPAYRRAVVLRESLRDEGVIELGRPR